MSELLVMQRCVQRIHHGRPVTVSLKRRAQKLSLARRPERRVGQGHIPRQGMGLQKSLDVCGIAVQPQLGKQFMKGVKGGFHGDVDDTCVCLDIEITSCRGLPQNVQL